MAQTPPSGQPLKTCPTCGTPAPLDAGWCSRCGHAYATQVPSDARGVRPPPASGPYAQFVQGYPAQQANTGLAITAIVLGIVSFVFMCHPGIGFTLSVLAIVFGALGLKQHRGMAVTGLVCGGLHLLLLLAILLLAMWGIGTLARELPRLL